MSSNQLTREAYDRLSAELEELTTVGRTRIAQAIEAARALGDLSENGDYHAAKDEQGRMEARIRQLEALLKNPEIVEGRSDVAGVGSKVTVRFSDGYEDTFIVGDLAEKTAEHDVMSPESPLGKALLGAKTGDTVSYSGPAGDEKVEILDIAT